MRMSSSASVLLACFVVLFQTQGTLPDVTYTQSYKIRDPLGYESSYLYERGTLEITCQSTGSEPIRLVNMAAPTTPIESGKGTVSHVFQLEPSLIEESFICYHQKAFSGGFFQIKEFICDPFPIIPQIQSCKDPDVCMISHDGKAKCESLNAKQCFLGQQLSNIQDSFMSSLPNMRFVCSSDSQNDESTHGACYARASGMKEITGLTTDTKICGLFDSAFFNGIKAEQDSFQVEWKDPSSWNVSFPGTPYIENTTCQLYNSKLKVIAIYTALKTQRTAVHTSHDTDQNIAKPEKLKMVCHSVDPTPNTKSLSFYVLLYDKGSFSNTTTLVATVKEPGESISVECSCSVSAGFFCNLDWKKIASPPIVPTTVISKTVTKKAHIMQPTVHECFSSVYVVGFPMTSGFVELLDVRKTESIGFNTDVFENPKGTKVEKNNSSFANNTNVPNAKASNSEDSKKPASLHPGIIVLIILMVILPTIGIAIGLVFWKRSKKQLPIEVDRNRIEEKRQSKHENSRRKTKTSELSPTEIFYQEMIADKEHLVSIANIDSFYMMIGNLTTRAAVFDSRDGILRAMNVIQSGLAERLAKQIDDMRTVKPAGRYLITCRDTKQPIKIDTYVGDHDLLCDEMRPRLNSFPVGGIHANFVTNNDGVASYILAQAPTQREMLSFLTVVCNQKVSLIVTIQAISEVEDRDESCINDYYAYYRLEKNDLKHYDRYTLVCLEKTEDRRSECRRILIRDSVSLASYTVTVLSFNKWSDDENAALSDIENIHLLRQRISQLRQTQTENAKTLIHCKTGIGRSCLLVAALNCCDFLTTRRPAEINVYKIVQKLRNERIGAIETGNQFCFLFLAIGDFRHRLFLDAAQNAEKTRNTKLAQKAEKNTTVKSTTTKVKSSVKTK